MITKNDNSFALIGDQYHLESDQAQSANTKTFISNPFVKVKLEI
jgi:hypothetical protein